MRAKSQNNSDFKAMISKKREENLFWVLSYSNNSTVEQGLPAQSS